MGARAPWLVLGARPLDATLTDGAPPRTPARSLAGAHSPRSAPRGRAVRAAVMQLRGRISLDEPHNGLRADFPELNQDRRWLALTDADEHRSRQPTQMGCGGLERRRGREIDKRRIDRLPCEEAGHDVGWSVSDTAIPHGNHVTAIGLQCVAGIELGQPVLED